MSYIDELLQKPEGKTLEFKRDSSSIKNIMKTIVAFANGAGGKIILAPIRVAFYDDGIEMELIGWTQPESPNSPRQKHRLTGVGWKLLQKIEKRDYLE